VGGATVSACGLSVNGDGQFATIANFDYASDGTYTIAYWIQKETCSTGPWEFIYSHSLHEGSMWQPDNPNFNMYLGCEDNTATRAGQESATFQRSMIVADDGSMITYDYQLAKAGEFDNITASWVHIVQAFSTDSITVMVNGELVSDGMFTNWAGEGHADMTNLVGTDSTLSALTAPYVGSTMALDIHIGARADGDAVRHYRGMIAGLYILDEKACSRAKPSLFFYG
jgi:hypothetical protein